MEFGFLNNISNCCLILLFCNFLATNRIDRQLFVQTLNKNVVTSFISGDGVLAHFGSAPQLVT